MLKEILEKRITAKWWSNKKVEEEKLQYVLDCIYATPSKNGKYNYEVHVLDEKSQDIKDWLYWESTYCLDEVRGKEGPIGNRRYNGQVTAPIVLVWLEDNSDPETRSDCLVSSTIAMIAAEEVGLQTGFCGCIDRKETGIKLNRSGMTTAIILGIGYIDHLDTSIQRDVIKEDMMCGFDYGNCAPGIQTPPRFKKPKFEELIYRR